MQRERQREEQQANPGAGAGGTAVAEELTQTREALQRLLAAGQESIRRGLMGQDSEAFLRASQQRGGE